MLNFRSLVVALLAVSASAQLCPSLKCTGPVATHVKDLKICDIDVVMAIGDSVTAAAVPFPLSYGIEEYRDVSFSIGGGSGAVTIPNIIANITGKKLLGPSLSHHIPEFPNWPRYATDNLNAAQSGARLRDVISGSGNQTEYLGQWAKAHGVADSQWKLITVFILANDICVACNGDRLGLAEMRTDFNLMLSYLRGTFKRALVQVAPLFNVSQVYTLASPSAYCSVEHDVISECPCLWHEGAAGRLAMDEATDAYNNVIVDVAAEWAARGYADFGVVAQPGMQGFEIPELSWLSPIDCFHPSAATHEVLAKGLFTQMNTPVGKKTYPFNWKSPVRCPTEDSQTIYN